jgi:hypothetical protein
MKRLALILVTAALFAGGVLTATVWMKAAKDSRVAATEEANWQLASNLDDQNLQMEYDNDRLQVRNDELDVQIANLQGRSTAAANHKLSWDHQKVSADELALQLARNARVFGPNQKITDAHLRLLHDLGLIHNAQFAAIALAFVTLIATIAFGFAFVGERRQMAVS